MVFHPLDIMLDITFGNTGKLQEIGQNPVTPPNGPGNLFSFFGKHKSTVFLMAHKSLRIKPFDHVGDTGLRDAQTSRDINNPGVSFGINEFLDPLQIILDGG